MIKKDFRVLSQLSIDINSPDAATLREFISRSGISDNSFYTPSITWGNSRIVVAECYRNRAAFFFYALLELSKNLQEYSDETSQLLVQLIEISPGHKALRIISNNREVIKSPLNVLKGSRRRFGRSLFDIRGAVLMYLKEVAYSNRGIVFIIDSDKHKIVTSHGKMVTDTGSCSGTEIQFIMSINIENHDITNLLLGQAV